jgi:hypothetical protein
VQRRKEKVSEMRQEQNQERQNNDKKECEKDLQKKDAKIRQKTKPLILFEQNFIMSATPDI